MRLPERVYFALHGSKHQDAAENEPDTQQHQPAADNRHAGVKRVGVVYSAPCVGWCHEELDGQAQRSGDDGRGSADLFPSLRGALL